MPYSNAALERFIKGCDRDANGKISRPEFIGFVLIRREALEKAFVRLDATKDGHITSTDIRIAAQSMSIQLSRDEVDRLIRVADRDGDGLVTVDDFVDMLLLVGDTHIEGLFDHWLRHETASVDMDAGVDPPKEAGPDESPWLVLVAGGAAGVCSRTLTAPMDRVRTVLQASDPRGGRTKRPGKRARAEGASSSSSGGAGRRPAGQEGGRPGAPAPASAQARGPAVPAVDSTRIIHHVRGGRQLAEHSSASAVFRRHSNHRGAPQRAGAESLRLNSDGASWRAGARRAARGAAAGSGAESGSLLAAMGRSGLTQARPDGAPPEIVRGTGAEDAAAAARQARGAQLDAKIAASSGTGRASLPVPEALRLRVQHAVGEAARPVRTAGRAVAATVSAGVSATASLASDAAVLAAVKAGASAAQGEKPASKPPGLVSARGVVPAARAILAEGGPLAFWRGNGTNVLKIAPETAIRFVAFDWAKRQIAADPGSVSPLERFVAGAFGGVVATCLVYPLEIAKTRLALSAAGELDGIGHCLSSLVRTEGLSAVYRGLGASLLGIIPYSGTELMTFTLLRDAYVARFPDKEPGVGTLLTCGAVASLSGQVVAFPLQLARTRLQAQGLPGREGTVYKGVLDCLSSVVRRDGLIGLYRGMLPGFMKSIPSCMISFAVFERSKSWLRPYARRVDSQLA